MVDRDSILLLHFNITYLLVKIISLQTNLLDRKSFTYDHNETLFHHHSEYFLLILNYKNYKKKFIESLSQAKSLLKVLFVQRIQFFSCLKMIQSRKKVNRGINHSLLIDLCRKEGSSQGCSITTKYIL